MFKLMSYAKKFLRVHTVKTMSEHRYVYRFKNVTELSIDQFYATNYKIVFQ